MDPPSLNDLEAMRYSELQRLAKAQGLKANMKAGKLLKILKGHFHPEAKTENISTDSDDGDNVKEESNGIYDKETASVSFVTQRRGRRQKCTSPKPEEELGSSNKTDAEHIRKSGSERKRRKHSLADKTGGQGPVGKTEERQTKESCAPSGGKIPRYVGRQTNQKPTTPNFKKLHDAHFKNMESIDKYMERKQKRLDAVSSSIHEVKMLAQTSNLLAGSEKTPSSGSKKPLKGRLCLKSPAPRKSSASSCKTPASKRRSGRCSRGNKSILPDKSGFKPSVFSSSKMNVRFSLATKDNEYKHSLAKTPARKSSGFGNVTPGSASTKTLPQSRKSFQNTPAIPNNEPATTPFTFTGKNVETPITSQKSKFDLQASLARPLGYEPHKGKLKPWANGKENQPALKANVSELKATYKQPQLRTREDRRQQQAENQKARRDKTLGNRRGVAVP